MFERKLDTSTNSPYPEVVQAREAFDAHIGTCTDCQPSLCGMAQIMWRQTCLTAARMNRVARDAGAAAHAERGL